MSNFQVSSASSSKPLSLAEQFKSTSGDWTCDACCVDNTPDVNKCVCCDAPKPGGSQPPQTKPLFGQTSITKSDGNVTVASKSRELPLTKAPPVVNCGFGDKFKLKTGECQSAKPGGASAVNSAIAPSAAQTPLGFGDKFKPEAGSWECDTCMLDNKSTVSKCVACETPKPGAKQSLNAPPGMYNITLRAVRVPLFS